MLQGYVVVDIAAEEGKRRGWLTDFHISRRTDSAAVPSLMGVEVGGRGVHHRRTAM